jgi:hypothetical protein
LPATNDLEDSDEVWLRHFPDLYGYRGHNSKNSGVFLLSPWEFVMFWECCKLPPPTKNSKSLSLWDDPDDKDCFDYSPNTDMENKELLFFPQIPGEVQLRRLWYMKRRRRPMVPAPSNTPMPDKQKNADKKARLFSIYLRPWCLDPSCATDEVEGVVILGIIVSCF